MVVVVVVEGCIDVPRECESGDCACTRILVLKQLISSFTDHIESRIVLLALQEKSQNRDREL